jgi:cardiolipin synthase (CMP-forming)
MRCAPVRPRGGIEWPNYIKIVDLDVEEAMQGRIWTVPNQITLLRLGFLPFFLILISYEQYRWALLILVLAGLSDAVDGLLARRLNQKSALGAYLDPIADKLLLSSSFVILAMKHEIPWWMTIFVLRRDMLILIVAAVIILISGYRPFPPSLLGKAATMFQIILVFLVVLGAAYPTLGLVTVKLPLMILVSVLAVVSGFHYSITIARKLSV